MRCLAVLHLYPPGHNAGAELMVHTMLRDLVRRGWDVQVMATEYRGEPYVRDGVKVMQSPMDREQAALFTWADVALTHLDATRRAMSWCRWGRPLVHVVHNHRQLTFHKVRPSDAALVVWNGEWVKACHQPWNGPSIIVRPPVSSSDYRVPLKRDGAVTLLNLYRPKGSGIFWHLARTERGVGRRFIGVLGSYGAQHVEPGFEHEVTILDNTPDVRAVYAQTRVLLVPSSYESWGRVAVEAMASGIPVMANPTPGLVEACTSPALGPCALFVDAEQPREWNRALAQLDSPATYRLWSKRALARSAELDAQTVVDLDTFAEAMAALAHRVAPTLAAHG